MSTINDSWVFINEQVDWSKKGETCLMVNFPDLNNIKDGKRIMVIGGSEKDIFAEYEKNHLIPFNKEQERKMNYKKI